MKPKPNTNSQPITSSNPSSSMDSLNDWPEPVIRVQSISESGIALIPARYIKPAAERTTIVPDTDTDTEPIPVFDLSSNMASVVSKACREWGFFQVVNHGVSPALMRRTLELWREFFHLPMEAKQAYANSPKTYEGYGSRLGMEEDAILDWGDYYFLHLFPLCLKNHDKWPSLPPSLREIVEEYGRELVKLCERMLGLLSAGLGVADGALQRRFGGEEAGACMRVNYYPKCPQPELALGLSSHSDPGGITVLLPDNKVRGLQVRRRSGWVTVQPLANALIVNVGDQVQVMSNATYRSVEHRVVVNSQIERLSIAFFYNPRSDLPVETIPELVGPDHPALYQPMTFDEYRLYIRKHGPRGKSQVESLKAI